MLQMKYFTEGGPIIISSSVGDKVQYVSKFLHKIR